MPKINISLTAFLVIPLILLDPSGSSAPTLAAALIHEAGHLVLIYLLGIGAKEIRITPYGLEISTKRHYRSFFEEIAVNVAGCAINFLTFAILRNQSGLLGSIAYSSLTFGVLNILPVLSLDGGEAMRAFFSIVFSHRLAEKVSRAISFITLVAIWCIAAYIFLFSGYNYSLFIMSVWLFGKIYCSY